MLLVISNFVYLKRALIPSMITQFESAFNVTIDSDKAVSDKGPCIFQLTPRLRRLAELTILIGRL